MPTEPSAMDSRTAGEAQQEPERRIRRGVLLILATLAGLGAMAMYLAPLFAELRASIPFGFLFVAIGLAQLYTVAAMLAKPTVRNVWSAAAAAFAVVAFWAVVRIGGLGTPDPWQPVDSVIGFTDDICAALSAFAAVTLGVLAMAGPRPKPSIAARLLTALGMVPLVPVIAIALLVGMLATTDGMAGAGFPGGTTAPVRLPAGRRSTVEYCRPDGVPLAMDIYTPATPPAHPAPVALYVHGGGLIFGDRKTTGVGAVLADQQGALFTPLQRELNNRGFVVASVDYRLPPEAPWPSQIEDVKCAVRFLRAHASGLGIDPARIGAWGSSAGGLLVSMLGLTDTTHAFDVGQDADQSSAVDAVVDMFGPADLSDLAGSESVMRAMVSIGLGDSPQVRRSASPVAQVQPVAPHFLILQGTDDTDVPLRQSELFATRLAAAQVPVTLQVVDGAGHSLVTPGQQPSPTQLTDTVADFFGSALSVGRP